MKHVTMGRLRRYSTTAIMLRGQRAFDDFWPAVCNLPRRQLLKALRDFMSPRRNHGQRHYRRSVAQWNYSNYMKNGRAVWLDESPPPRHVGKLPELAMPYGGQP